MRREQKKGVATKPRLAGLMPYLIFQPDGAIRIYVPLASPSQNEFHYSHWTRQRVSKQQWSLLLQVAVNQWAGFSNELKPANGPRTLRIERHGKRPLDVPNGIGGAKGIIDCLVKMRLLVDDTPELLRSVDFENIKLQSHEAPHTIIILEDCV